MKSVNFTNGNEEQLSLMTYENEPENIEIVIGGNTFAIAKNDVKVLISELGLMSSE